MKKILIVILTIAFAFIVYAFKEKPSGDVENNFIVVKILEGLGTVDQGIVICYEATPKLLN
jgi:hypothetical protein